MIENYNPSNRNIHIIRITLNYKGATGHISFKRGGNCKGTSILSEGVSFFEYCDENDIKNLVENDCQLSMCEVEGVTLFKFVLNSGEKQYEFDSADENFLQELVVAIEITDVEQEGGK